MWLENLKELKERTGMSSKQIADKAEASEKSVKRVFTGDAKNPGVELVRKIIDAMGGSWHEIFAESGAVIGGQDLATLQTEVNRLTEENAILAQNLNIATVDLAVQKDKVSALETEIELLKMKLIHKDEIISLHNYYGTVISGITKGHSKKHGHE
jgi:transcriptional regulator with XRE-family HTH domain